MVSVFEGQLTRTWCYSDEDKGAIQYPGEKRKKKKHIINLYHDTITGVRSATVDYDEVPNSLGNSSFLMESIGHRIKFTVGNKSGHIEIKRGWMRFEYNCYIGNNLIIESTGQLAVQDKDIFKVSIEGMI
jgi:hypothetical protein